MIVCSLFYPPNAIGTNCANTANSKPITIAITNIIMMFFVCFCVGVENLLNRMMTTTKSKKAIIYNIRMLPVVWHLRMSFSSVNPFKDCYLLYRLTRLFANTITIQPIVNNPCTKN